MNKHLLITGLLSTAIVSSIAVTQTVAQLTPQQVASIKNVTSSAITEDGKTIAYTVSVPADPQKENAGNKSLLYILNINNGESRPFYTSTSVSQIKFRPNKGTITFLTRQGNEKTNALYEISLNGGEATKVYQHEKGNILTYEFANDGEQFAIITMEQAVAPKTNLTYTPTFFEESYNNRIVYLVKQGLAQKVNLEGAAYMLAWSPNNNELAISVAPTAAVDDEYMKQTIKIVNANTLSTNSTIEHKGKLGQFVWSPNSDQLALVGAYDINDPTNGTILIANHKGGAPKVIDGQYQGKYEHIKWNNNNEIIFHSSEGTSAAIGKLDINSGKKSYWLQTDTHAITSFAISNKGLISFTASTPTHPNELFTLTTNKKGIATKCTNSNSWLKDVKLGRQEVVTYKARDGKYDIQGMLIYPLDYKAGQSYPLITVVHGGPESHFSNGWITGYSNPGQMAAAQGYAVFYPNYRGSTGRGVDFTYSSQADLAGKEFDDIVDGVDYLISKGIADKNRIGVTGGSYGGYASAWMSTYYSDRFAAAVMFVGISNNISKFGTSDIPTEMALVHERGYIWEDWKKQLEISPIYHVDKANTPILIMHGAEDPRVHPAQSMELYRHIKVRKPDVPVRLIYYPGEGHGNARSGSKYDYNLRLLQWFDIYLKSGNRKAAMPSLDLPE